MRFLFLASCFLATVGAAPGSEWVMTKDFPGTHRAEVIGAPQFLPGGKGELPCVRFDGRRDGFILPENPVAGWPAFTIEILFRADPRGPEEQRFFCLEGANHTWLTLESRVAGGQWSLDTYLSSSAGRLPLLDRSLVHPCGQWHWAALRYDGHVMTSFVDGHRELSGPVAFPAMGPGRASLGVRLNRVYWFAGDVARLRFSPTALPSAALEKP